MAKLLGEIHPGEVLLDDFMTPMGITASELAVALDVPSGQIGEFVDGTRSITPDIALRLGRHFKMGARFWVNLQAEYDRRMSGTR